MGSIRCFGMLEMHPRFCSAHLLIEYSVLTDQKMIYRKRTGSKYVQQKDFILFLLIF